MKGLLVIGIVSLLMIHNVAVATTREEVNQKTKAAVDAAVDYSKEQKATAEKNMEESLTSMSNKISELKRDAKKLTGKAKVEMDQQISAMEKKQAELSQDYDKLKKTSGRAWSEMKSGFSKAFDSLSDGYEKAKTEFKNESH